MREEQDMGEQSVWSPRFARWSIVLGVLALTTAGLGLTLARYDVIGKLAGFSALLGGGLIALVAFLFGVAALVAGRKHPPQSRGTLLAAMGISLAYVGFLATRPMVAGDAPAIHDVTTDLADPPRFELLPLRADNLAGVGTVENWRRIHAAAYGDLRPIVIARPARDVVQDAERLARAAGWRIAVSDPARGHIEATASVSYIRFQDDVVIRILPIADGAQSRVDMRSVSRVGVGDLGVNAKRVRAFLKALADT